MNERVARQDRKPGRRPSVSYHKALLAILVAMLAILFAPFGTASAHDDDQSYLYLDFGETITARLQMPFADIDDVLGIDISGSEDEIDEAIQANAVELTRYAEAHFDVGSEGTVFQKVFVEASRFGGTDHAEVAFAMATGDQIPSTLEVRLDPFLDEIADRDALLLVANDWQRGVVGNEGEHLLRFVDSSTQTVVLGESSQWTNFTTSVSSGLDHIRTGPDHMLFIFSLVLPSVLVWITSWKPKAGFGSSLLRVTKIMTMFTLAHSVTFTLAGAGVVPTPSPRVTESIIALSIAATALHNLRPIFRDREWIIAFVFGLFHGFGFASLVSSLDVSTETQLVSLAGRNVGIEIGQLIVVLLVFPALFLLRVTHAYLPILKIASVGLIIASIGWMTERLFDAPAITSSIINRVLDFPLILIFVALATLAAYLWHRREAELNRLIPPVDPNHHDDEDITPSPSPALAGQR